MPLCNSSLTSVQPPVAKMEKDHDPGDLLALLIPEQHRTAGTRRLHHHIRSRTASLASESIRADLLPDSRLRYRHARDSSYVSQVWPSTYPARKYCNLLCLVDRLFAMHFVRGSDGMPDHPSLV